MSDSRKSSASSASKSSATKRECLRTLEQQTQRPRIRRNSPMAHIGVTRYPLLPSLKPSTRRLRVEMCFPELDPSVSKSLKPITHQHPNEKLVFLAGGMTAGPDWRSEAQSDLSIEAARKELLTNVVLINPYFKAKAPNAGIADQLTQWQTDHFAKCDLVVFWFPRCDSCMVSWVPRHEYSWICLTPARS